MSTITDIGTLISRQPDIHGGCPIITGTGVTVRRLAIWYKQSLSAEEIADRIGHLTLKDSFGKSENFRLLIWKNFRGRSRL
ncbi:MULTISPECIES: DUF433 domain-containing protein [unclassified Microcoleus]|uniref:DUF433 domain-containing protein n=1 Tax=unclassified Microcoleus TaxID=2642155 RepID=UPI002FD3CFFA